MDKWNSYHGFTLLELMVTLSILVITLSFAIPSFDQLLVKSQITNNAETLFEFIRQSKYESVKANKTLNVYFEPVSDGYCFGLTGDTAFDCSKSVDLHSKLFISSSNQVSLKLVEKSTLIDIPTGKLFSVDPRTATINQNKILVFSEPNNSQLIEGVRIINNGYIRRCSQSHKNKKQQCV